MLPWYKIKFSALKKYKNEICQKESAEMNQYKNPCQYPFPEVDLLNIKIIYKLQLPTEALYNTDPSLYLQYQMNR